jgi:hypothetical protein
MGVLFKAIDQSDAAHVLKLPSRARKSLNTSRWALSYEAEWFENVGSL